MLQFARFGAVLAPLLLLSALTWSVLQQQQVGLSMIKDKPRISRVVARQAADHDADDYHEACRAAHVPVPGAFATDPGWSKRADLDAEAHRYFFRPNWSDAEVWTYRAADRGYCVALVRRNPLDPGGPSFVGTICVDSSQTNACFFDSMIYVDSGTKRLGWDEFRQRDFSELVHPMDGEDRCNNCHLGANPFVVHPETVLGRTVMSMYPKLGPKPKRFEFVGLDGRPERWSNFDAIPATGDTRDKCMSCHDIPHITKGHKFCDSIIRMAANRTMPPGHWPAEPAGGPEFWPDKNGCFADGLSDLKDYFASMVRLKSICTGQPEKTCSSNP